MMNKELKLLSQSISNLNDEILKLKDRQNKSTMKSEKEKYAELILSMSTDFLLGKIDFNYYANTLDIINSKIQIENAKKQCKCIRIVGSSEWFTNGCPIHEFKSKN